MNSNDFSETIYLLVWKKKNMYFTVPSGRKDTLKCWFYSWIMLCTGVIFLVSGGVLLGKGCLQLQKVFHPFPTKDWKNFTNSVSTDSKYMIMHCREILLLIPTCSHRRSAFELSKRNCWFREQRMSKVMTHEWLPRACTAAPATFP